MTTKSPNNQSLYSATRGDEFPEDLAEPETDVEILLREKARFPIYVHSKVMFQGGRKSYLR